MELNPAQQRVVDELLAFDAPRPEFDPALAVRLRDQLEDALWPWPSGWGGPRSWSARPPWQRVLACEEHHLDEVAAGFQWSARTRGGTVVHKALEMALFLPARCQPDGGGRCRAHQGGRGRPRAGRVAARRARRPTGPTSAPRPWPRSRAFETSWPPLERRWRPRTEAPSRLDLCDDRVSLRARVDLALERAEGRRAGVLIIDFKTGNRHPQHLDDLRFYALVHGIQTGVPPFRVASYYLDASRWHHEDVTEELLEVTVARVIDGATRLAQLHLGDRDPTRAAGPQCSWCRLRHDCDDGRAWAENRRGDAN